MINNNQDMDHDEISVSACALNIDCSPTSPGSSFPNHIVAETDGSIASEVVGVSR